MLEGSSSIPMCDLYPERGHSLTFDLTIQVKVRGLIVRHLVFFFLLLGGSTGICIPPPLFPTNAAILAVLCSAVRA